MARQVFFLDLKAHYMAEEYEILHWPGNPPQEVISDILGTGIDEMQIFRFADRLVMITQARDCVDADARVASEASAQWEKRMDAFQRPLEGEPGDAKWKPGKLIFDLHDHSAKDTRP